MEINPFAVLLPPRDPLHLDSAEAEIVSALIDGGGETVYEVPLHEVPSFIEVLADRPLSIAQEVLNKSGVYKHFFRHLSATIEWTFEQDSSFSVWIASLKTEPVSDLSDVGMDYAHFMPTATVFMDDMFDPSPLPLVHLFTIKPLGYAVTKFVKDVFKETSGKIFNELFGDLFEGGKKLNPWYVFSLDENGELVATETAETCRFRLENRAQLCAKNASVLRAKRPREASAPLIEDEDVKRAKND